MRKMAWISKLFEVKSTYLEVGFWPTTQIKHLSLMASLLHICTPGSSGDYLHSWVPITHLGNQDLVPSFQVGLIWYRSLRAFSP